MKRLPRLILLLPALLLLRVSVAQNRSASGLPQLPETALQPVISSTAIPLSNGMQFQYQLVRVYNDRCVYLAPAWHGQVKLEPLRRGLFSTPDPAEVDALLVGALNELAAEGWELLEVQTLVQPTAATQKVETSLPYNDPQRPAYTGKTAIETVTQTRYLLRRPVARR